MRTTEEHMILEDCNNSITIAQAALCLNVTQMSIRNWIKTGYLSLDEDNQITINSIRAFQQEIAGRVKLNARANKSLKDSHNHKDLQALFFDRIDKEASLENIAQEYEQSLSESYRNKEGIYYTPEYIAQDMLKGITPEQISGKSFVDPCCGGGSFIREALKLGFDPKRIYGFDTDAVAVALTKKIIYDYCGYDSPNIQQMDFLQWASQQNAQFDYIFTNPPWGKKLAVSQKQHLTQAFHAHSATDTSSLFLLAAFKLLAPNGHLGFLLPEAFFNIRSFTPIREKVMQYSISRMVDYNKAFKGLLTKAQALLLCNEVPNNNWVTCQVDRKQFQRRQDSFTENPNMIFNFWITQPQADVIAHLYRGKAVYLKNNAKFGLGIVTGNNRKFIFDSPAPGLVPIVKGSDILKSAIKNPTHFINPDLSLYQQTAPKSLYASPKKIIYKFISSDLCMFYDTKKRLVINSANFFVVDPDFPIPPKELTKLLNSRFMSWVFQSVFRTYKILKSDLQALPLYDQYFKLHPKFNEKTYLEFLGIKKVKNTYQLDELLWKKKL